MQINLRTSEANHQVVKDLTYKMPKGTDENVIARIAFAYSISKNINLLNELPADSKGKEYKDHTLLGKNRDFYVSLICQNYNIHRSHPDIPKLFKMHLDHGLDLLGKIFSENKNYSIFDFLLQSIENGIESLENTEVSLDPVANFYQDFEKEFYSEVIDLEVGHISNSTQKIIIQPNNISKYNNCHIAVAGSSGTGKTQFALELLRQFVVNSDKRINFIYLDFKGLKKGEEKSDFYRPFFEETDTKFIDVTQSPFPLNPLSFIDNVNEKNKIRGVNKFVDIVSKYGKIGENKEQALRQAVKEIFLEKKNGEYPTFPEIYKKVIDIEGNKFSRLRGFLEKLSDYEIFAQKGNPHENFLSDNVYLSLSGELEDTIRFTSVFLIINYIYNIFMNMENAPVDNDIVALRYVLLIDEAHVIFKEKKSQDILEKMLREIRSKGVAVILLSQGIEEFNQPAFDFSTMCEIAFLLQIKDINNVKVINKFLGFSESEGNKAKRSLEQMEKGQAISNIKEYKKGELFSLKQFKDTI